MRRNKQGDPLWKTVDVKIIYPEGRKPEHRVFRAGPGTAFTLSGIEQIVEGVANALEQRHKYWEFRFVPRGANAFTFVYVGLREQKVAVPMSTELLNVEA